MRSRLLLAALVSLGLAACAETPDAPSSEGVESPVQTPLEVPPGAHTVPEGAVGREPGVPGSDRAEEAWALGGGACYAFADYVVRTRPHEAAPGEDVLVFRRRGGDARAQCDGAPGDALFAETTPDRAGYFFGLVGDHLLLDEGTGPNGRTVRVVDLASGAVLHEARYEEPITVSDGGLVYGMEPEVAESLEEVQALGVECPEAETWFGEGLSVGLSPQVRYDFAARTAEPTGAVLCVPLQ